MLVKDLRFHLYSFFNLENSINFTITSKAHRDEIYDKYKKKIKDEFDYDEIPTGISPTIYYAKLAKELVKEKRELIAYAIIHHLFSNDFHQEHWQDFLSIKNDITISSHLAVKNLIQITDNTSYKFNHVITDEHLKYLTTMFETCLNKMLSNDLWLDNLGKNISEIMKNIRDLYALKYSSRFIKVNNFPDTKKAFILGNNANVMNYAECYLTLLSGLMIVGAKILTHLILKKNPLLINEDLTQQFNCSLLHNAVEAARPDLITDLMSHQVDVNQHLVTYVSEINMPKKIHVYSPLMLAIIQLCRHREGKLHVLTEDSIYRAQKSTIEILLKNNASVDAPAIIEEGEIAFLSIQDYCKCHHHEYDKFPAIKQIFDMIIDKNDHQDPLKLR